MNNYYNRTTGENSGEYLGRRERFEAGLVGFDHYNAMHPVGWMNWYTLESLVVGPWWPIKPKLATPGKEKPLAWKLNDTEDQLIVAAIFPGNRYFVFTGTTVTSRGLSVTDDDYIYCC